MATRNQVRAKTARAQQKLKRRAEGFLLTGWMDRTNRGPREVTALRLCCRFAQVRQRGYSRLRQSIWACSISTKLTRAGQSIKHRVWRAALGLFAPTAQGHDASHVQKACQHPSCMICWTSLCLQATQRGPRQTGLGYRPHLMPAYHVARDTGTSAST